ncbi:sialidase family protein [Plantactinospora sp. ZYX-F-223]|uniref:sialidase family protein n=1 Tax=Plantactinospora sp. ZYX-F-223 TaxID=3144103 RepID=UPI0031FC6541
MVLPISRHGVPRRTVLAAGAAAAGAAVLGARPALGSGSTPVARDGFFAESTVWASGEDGVVTHFVYGLAVTTRDTVLAFSEARLSRADDGAHHVVCRRSVDGGATWGDSIAIEASEGEESWANPTPLVDRWTGRVFVFYALNEHNAASRVFFRFTDDDGRSWSDRSEVTGLFDGDEHEWTFHLPGPGHGIQLADGRLVQQVWHRRGVAFPADQRRYGVGVIVSDDHGATWRAGGVAPVSPIYPVNESRLVQRPDGSIVLNGRYSSGGVHPRITAVSVDRGESWSPLVFDSSVAHFTAVDASFTRYTGGPGSHAVSRTLFSRPDSTAARENLTVSLSYDEGCSYPYSRTVYPGRSSYSDIARLADGTILVLYGKDVSTNNAVDHVALARFDLAWLTGGEDSLRRGPRIREFRLPAETARWRVSGGAAEAVVDPNASGYRLLDYAAAAPGDHLELSVPVPLPGVYVVTARCRQDAAAGVVSASIVGVGPGETFAPAIDVGTAFREFSCGRFTIARPGTYRLRLAVDGPGPGGGTGLGLDHIRLTQVPPGR